MITHIVVLVYQIMILKSAFWFSCSLADKANAVGQIALLLTANRINPASRTLIEDAYAAIYDANDVDLQKKAWQVAQILMLSTPEFATTNLVVPTDSERTPTPRDTKVPDLPYKAIVYVNLFGGMGKCLIFDAILVYNIGSQTTHSLHPFLT